MKYSVHAKAKKEFRVSSLHYKNIDPDLGSDFAEMIIDSFDKIASNPESCPRYLFRTRRYVLPRRFKYSIVYLIGTDEVIIVAVMHHSRRPDYWLDRLDDLGM